MSSMYGESLRLSVWGQSHGAAIGMTLDGVRAGLPVDLIKLQQFLNRRAPGQNDLSTPRKEEDLPEFLSGIVDGFTCGAPITAMIRNTNTRSGDYRELMDSPRPGHADFTAQMKYNGYQDVAGGGHFSGRLTAPLCIAGGLCKQWLEARGIHIHAHIQQIAGIEDDRYDPVDPLLPTGDTFPTLNPERAVRMKQAIIQAKEAGDSVGGVVECAITGLPVGIGEPMFGGLEGKIALIVYGIPAVKGVEFGSGFACAGMRGSRHNDPFCVENGKVITKTNHAGGILGGISTGMPVIFRAAFKPTPSISQIQHTVKLSTMQPCQLSVKGRHDPCVVPRAVPVVEAAAAIAVWDAILCAGQGE